MVDVCGLIISRYLTKIVRPYWHPLLDIHDSSTHLVPLLLLFIVPCLYVIPSLSCSTPCRKKKKIKTLVR